MKTITALIHTKNSEKTLQSALDSVKFADEIVVVDMHSTDTTIPIVKKYTDKIYSFDDVGYVEPARNFGLSKVTSDWVLILDSDEEVPEKLVDAFKELKEQDEVVWIVPRKNLVWGKWIAHTGWWPDFQVRFFPNGTVSWEEKVHSIPDISGEVRAIAVDEEFALIHHNYDSVDEYIDRLNTYTSKEILGKKNSIDSSDPLFSFTDEFLQRYFRSDGFLDGDRGLYLSFSQGFYEFLKDVKRKEVLGFSSEQSDIDDWIDYFRKSLLYWKYEKKIKHSTSSIATLAWKLKRKLGI